MNETHDKHALDIFDGPMKLEDGTWRQPRLGKLLREARYAMGRDIMDGAREMREVMPSFLGSIGYLMLLEQMGAAVECERMKGTATVISTLLDISEDDAHSIANLLFALATTYALPRGVRLDHEAKQGSIVCDHPDGSTVIDITMLADAIELCVVSLPDRIAAGELELADGFSFYFKAT